MQKKNTLKSKWDPLKFACTFESLDAVKEIINSGVRIIDFNDELMAASKNPDSTVLSYLLNEVNGYAIIKYNFSKETENRFDTPTDIKDLCKAYHKAHSKKPHKILSRWWRGIATDTSASSSSEKSPLAQEEGASFSSADEPLYPEVEEGGLSQEALAELNQKEKEHFETNAKVLAELNKEETEPLEASAPPSPVVDRTSPKTLDSPSPVPSYRTESPNDVSMEEINEIVAKLQEKEEEKKQMLNAQYSEPEKIKTPDELLSMENEKHSAPTLFEQDKAATKIRAAWKGYRIFKMFSRYKELLVNKKERELASSSQNKNAETASDEARKAEMLEDMERLAEGDEAMEKSLKSDGKRKEKGKEILPPSSSL